MAFEGANPEQLEALASSFSACASQLNDARSRVGHRVHSSTWRGPNADHFRHDWDARWSRSLDAVVASLRNAEKSLRTNAQQQREASDGSGQTTGHGGVLGFLSRGVADVTSAGRDAVHGAQHVADAVGHDLVSGVRAVEHSASEVWAIEVAGYHEMVSSPVFAEAIGGLKIASSLAIFLPPPAGLAVAGVLGGVAFLGDMAIMGNTGQWDFGKLGEDGLSAGLSIAGAGLVGQAFKGASSVDLITEGSRDISTMDNVTKVVTGARAFDIGFSEEQTGVQTVRDVRAGNYVGVAADAISAVSPVVGLSGDHGIRVSANGGGDTYFKLPSGDKLGIDSGQVSTLGSLTHSLSDTKDGFAGYTKDPQ